MSLYQAHRTDTLICLCLPSFLTKMSQTRSSDAANERESTSFTSYTSIPHQSFENDYQQCRQPRGLHFVAASKSLASETSMKFDKNTKVVTWSHRRTENRLDYTLLLEDLPTDRLLRNCDRVWTLVKDPALQKQFITSLTPRHIYSFLWLPQFNIGLLP